MGKKKKAGNKERKLTKNYNREEQAISGEERSATNNNKNNEEKAEASANSGKISQGNKKEHVKETDIAQNGMKRNESTRSPVLESLCSSSPTHLTPCPKSICKEAFLERKQNESNKEGTAEFSSELALSDTRGSEDDSNTASLSTLVDNNARKSLNTLPVIEDILADSSNVAAAHSDIYQPFRIPKESKPLKITVTMKKPSVSSKLSYNALSQKTPIKHVQKQSNEYASVIRKNLLAQLKSYDRDDNPKIPAPHKFRNVNLPNKLERLRACCGISFYSLMKAAVSSEMDDFCPVEVEELPRNFPDKIDNTSSKTSDSLSVPQGNSEQITKNKRKRNKKKAKGKSNLSFTNPSDIKGDPECPFSCKTENINRKKKFNISPSSNSVSSDSLYVGTAYTDILEISPKQTCGSLKKVKFLPIKTNRTASKNCEFDGGGQESCNSNVEGIFNMSDIQFGNISNDDFKYMSSVTEQISPDNPDTAADAISPADYILEKTNDLQTGISLKWPLTESNLSSVNEKTVSIEDKELLNKHIKKDTPEVSADNNILMTIKENPSMDPHLTRITTVTEGKLWQDGGTLFNQQGIKYSSCESGAEVSDSESCDSGALKDIFSLEPYFNSSIVSRIPGSVPSVTSNNMLLCAERSDSLTHPESNCSLLQNPTSTLVAQEKIPLEKNGMSEALQPFSEQVTHNLISIPLQILNYPASNQLQDTPLLEHQKLASKQTFSLICDNSLSASSPNSIKLPTASLQASENLSLDVLQSTSTPPLSDSTSNTLSSACPQILENSSISSEASKYFTCNISLMRGAARKILDSFWEKCWKFPIIFLILSIPTAFRIYNFLQRNRRARHTCLNIRRYLFQVFKFIRFYATFVIKRSRC